MADGLQAVTEKINALSIHETVRDVLWVVPAFQTLHILAVGVVFSGSLIIALRALGLAGTHWTLGRWHKRLSAWTGWALVALLLSGLVLILAEPERELLNSLFQIKMPLVIATTLLSFGIARRFDRNGGKVSIGVKLGAVVIVLLWAVIMGLGRWIAYAG